MNKEKIGKVAVTGLLAAGLMASFGGIAFAAANSGNPTPSPRFVWLTGDGAAGAVSVSDQVYGGGNVVIRQGFAFNQNTLKEALGDLVSAGTITQAQSDAVLAYMQQNLPPKPIVTGPADVAPPAGVSDQVYGPGPVLRTKIVDPLQDLVNKGTLTSAQAQAIRDKERSLAEQQRQQQWQAALNSMVSAGTITQTQATNVLNFLAANDQKVQGTLERTKANLQSLLAQTKSMTPEQRAQYFKQNRPAEISNPFQQMVDQGIITQSQADALKQALQAQAQQQVKDNLNALATQGTITQDQVSKIEAFMAADKQQIQGTLSQTKDKMQSLFTQTKNMTPQARAQYLKQNLPRIEDPVSRMVDQGIITQQQADAVRGALGAGGAGFGRVRIGIGGADGGQVFIGGGPGPVSFSTGDGGGQVFVSSSVATQS